MNIRIVSSFAFSAALIAAALPTAALAKGAAETGLPAPDGMVVVAQDSGTDKPQVEGWSTNPNDFSDEDCQGFADQIETSIGDALDNLDANDLEGMFANLDSADAMEGLANEMGCVISYPEKSTAEGKGADEGAAETDGIDVIAQDSGSDGGRESGDTACAQSNTAANEVLDAAGAAFDANDIEYGFALLDLADSIEADAAAEGCTIKYT